MWFAKQIQEIIFEKWIHGLFYMVYIRLHAQAKQALKYYKKLFITEISHRYALTYHLPSDHLLQKLIRLFLVHPFTFGPWSHYTHRRLGYPYISVIIAASGAFSFH
jgi:hypothetical protein